MIITISGDAGSGKSSVSEKLVKILGYEYYSTGSLQRKIAEDMNISINELGILEKKNPEIDKRIDNETKKLQNKDNIILDSWLAAFFIPKAFKIFLTADINIRAQRRLKQKRTTESFNDIDETIKSLKEREETNRERWIKLYGFDYKDKKNYDLFIDTSNLNIDEVVRIIIDKLNSIKNIKSKI